MTRHRHLLQTLKEILTRAFAPPTIPVGTTELQTRGGRYLLCAGVFRFASHLMPTSTLWHRYYHPYLADEKPTLQQDQLTCPLFKHWWKVKPGFRITCLFLNLKIIFSLHAIPPTRIQGQERWLLLTEILIKDFSERTGSVMGLKIKKKKNSGGWAGREGYYRKKEKNLNKCRHKNVKCRFSSYYIDQGNRLGSCFGDFWMTAYLP